MKTLINIKQVQDTLEQMTQMAKNSGINIDVTFSVSRVTLHDLAKQYNEEIKDCSGVFGSDVKAAFINQGSNLSISFWSYGEN